MSYNVKVALAKTPTPMPTGVVFGHTNLTVTDAANVVQTFALNGSEATPWTQTVAGLADGASSYSAQDVDATGAAIGVPVVATYTPAATTFPASTGITVTPA